MEVLDDADNEGLEPTHDCLKNLSYRCQYLEGLLEDLTDKFKSFRSNVRRTLMVDDSDMLGGRHSKGRGMVTRLEQELPSMSKLQFRPDQHACSELSRDECRVGQSHPQIQTYREKLTALPVNT